MNIKEAVTTAKTCVELEIPIPEEVALVFIKYVELIQALDLRDLDRTL